MEGAVACGSAIESDDRQADNAHPVVPAKAGTHFDLDLGCSCDSKSKMDPGFRRDDD